MRDLAKVTHVDGVSYCDVCGYWIDAYDTCSASCPTASPPAPNRASARAEPRKPKVSYADIKAAFERNKEGL